MAAAQPQRSKASATNSATWRDVTPAGIVLITGPEEYLGIRAMDRVRSQVQAATPDVEVTRLNAGGSHPPSSVWFRVDRHADWFSFVVHVLKLPRADWWSFLLELQPKGLRDAALLPTKPGSRVILVHIPLPVDRFQQEPRAWQNAYDWYRQSAARKRYRLVQQSPRHGSQTEPAVDG